VAQHKYFRITQRRVKVNLEGGRAEHDERKKRF
jgi:hypothetical protein